MSLTAFVTGVTLEMENKPKKGQKPVVEKTPVVEEKEEPKKGLFAEVKEFLSVDKKEENK
jgi:hypothetical protein